MDSSNVASLLVAADIIAQANQSGVTAPDAIPTAYNGSLGVIDLAKPVDYSSDNGKIAVDSAGRYDLRGTIKIYLWNAMNKPAQAVAVTQVALDSSAKNIARAIAREKFYTIWHRAKVNLGFRASDTVIVGSSGAGVISDATVNAIYNAMTRAATAQAQIAHEARMVLYSFMANAIHRKQHGGHSWFSKEMSNGYSITMKATAVAGASQDALIEYMRDFGHDGNHHLSDDSLDEIALALVGKETPHALVPYGTTASIKQADMYAGNDIRGKRVSEIFQMDDAAIDRYPPGELGKAALIIGLDYIVAMAAAVIMKVSVKGHENAITNVTDLSRLVRSTELGRPALKSIETNFGPLMSFAHGFAVETGTIASEQYLAYDKHASRYATESASGVAFAQVLKSVKVHSRAIEGAILTLIDRIGSAADTLSVNAITLSGGKHNSKLMVVEVAESDNDEMLKMMAALKP